jgi:tetratricopeptide (TPR) repeat protein
MLIDILYRFPASIPFLSEEELIHIYSNHIYIDEAAIRKIESEILYRYWLYKGYPTPELKKLSDPLLKEGDSEALVKIESLADLEDSKDIQSFDKELSDKIMMYLKSDGIIPVVRDKCAYPLCFTLIKSPDNTVKVLDLHGTVHSSWTYSLNNIHLDIFSGWTVKLNCSFPEATENTLANFIPTGTSFHLPVLLAILNKTGQITFQSKDVISTGSLEHGHLCQVDCVKEKAEMSKSLGVKLFLAPEQYKPIEWVTPLKKDSTIGSVTSQIIKLLDASHLSILDWRHAVEHMRSLRNDVHYGIVPMESNALPRIERYEKTFRNESKTEELLDALMLKSVIFCHLGKTVDSMALNKECRAISHKNKSFYKYFRLGIEHIVNLTDTGDYPEAEKFLSTNLKLNDIKVKIVDVLEKNDLLMRFYGTLGQLFLYGHISGYYGPALRNKSLRYFNNAAKLARDYSEKPDEYCHDLNYMHLWHAINILGGPEEEIAYENSINSISILSSDEAKKKNRAYLYRQKWFGAYRNYLITGKFPDFSRYVLPDQKNAEGWTLSTTLKYKATLLAASGNFDEAKTLFEESIEILDNPNNPLLNLIGMTSAVQAWQSLRGTSKDNFARKCRKRAVDFFGMNKILDHYKFASSWKAYLTGKIDKNPQINYQY